jgi:sugar phosphate isomerase/epimerase
MKIGVRGHDLIAGLTNVESLASALSRNNLDTLQLVCHKSIEGVPYQAGAMSHTKTAEISAALCDNDVHVTLFGAYFNPAHPKREKAELGVAVFKDNMELARLTGGGTVGSETGSYNGDSWTYNPQNRTPEALKTVTAVFAELCKAAADKGVYVGMEGAAGHVCHNVAALKQAVTDIGSPNLRVIFDYFNFMEAANMDYERILDEGLNTFPKIHCFHMKDCVTDGPLESCAFGKGTMDLRRIVKMIKQYDKDAALILEGTVGEDIPNAVALLRELWETA